MDELAIMLITVPVIMPALNHLGIDPVWFGILFIINQQMGLILPPVGMIVFVLAGMIPDIPMYTIYRGIMPFAAAMPALLPAAKPTFSGNSMKFTAGNSHFMPFTMPSEELLSTTIISNLLFISEAYMDRRQFLSTADEL